QRVPESQSLPGFDDDALQSRPRQPEPAPGGICPVESRLRERVGPRTHRSLQSETDQQSDEADDTTYNQRRSPALRRRLERGDRSTPVREGVELRAPVPDREPLPPPASNPLDGGAHAHLDEEDRPHHRPGPSEGGPPSRPQRPGRDQHLSALRPRHLQRTPE